MLRASSLVLVATILAISCPGMRSSVRAQAPVSGDDGGSRPPQIAADQTARPLPDRHAATGRSLLSTLRAGGPVFFPIGFCSFLLLVFVFERAISLRRKRVIPRPFVRRMLQQLEDGQLNPSEAIELCHENRSPTATVFQAALRKWDRSSVEVEQAVIDAGERVANDLRKYLRLFNGISTVSPLLGLLGTVMGMIDSFQNIASADSLGRPELLATGISAALLTTAGGLLVAIPALVAYLFFASRVDRLIIEIDALAQEVVQSVATDGWKRVSKRKPAKAA